MIVACIKNTNRDISNTLNTFFTETKRKTSQSVPEPSSTAGLLILGAVGMFLWRQRF
jgi:PEP-CTERM motif